MTYEIKIFGIVQGVGFRPFVDKLARSLKLNGTVANRGSYVEIFVKCSAADLENFCRSLKSQAPPRAIILDMKISAVDVEKNFDGFKIIESLSDNGNIFVSPDIAICDNCKAELFDKTNRRYLHPFINCTDCGPRLTIMQKMPYDRERTSMNFFQMCDNCRNEYLDSKSRRYDAQPVCCNECGPEIFILDSSERGVKAIQKVRQIIKGGGIAAIKGLGGFHLACDAANFETVQRLRQLKNRPQKPFAVMIKNCPDIFKKFLDNYQKPIVLLSKKFFNVAENVAPNNHKLGVMLPYTPLHLLIFNYPDNLENFPSALIMTSGNVSGAPLATNDYEARCDLSKICDVILTHNREILIRADDSVADIFNDEIYMIRRSRGYAPLPIHCNLPNSKNVLAIGGELKNTFCLAKNNLFYLSPYVGDLTDIRTVDALKNSVERMIELLEIQPEIIACDLHPRYNSVKIAEEFAAKFDVPLIKVQHHYAHILSCMAENNFFEPVIGVAFDGTGYGTDGTIWGGEFLICDTKNFERVDSIMPFIQAGGDKSSTQSWRIAVAMVQDITKNFTETKKIAAELNLTDETKLNGQIFLLKNNLNCIKSTSAGRLFDAISAILGLCKNSTFEGEAAMTLQFNAECTINAECEMRNAELLANCSTSTIDIFAKLLERRLNGEDVNQLAFDFHVRLAKYIAETCKKIRDDKKISTIALSGGVFQNTLLLGLTIEQLTLQGFKILRHRLVPPNDGGLALGQAVFATNQ